VRIRILQLKLKFSLPKSMRNGLLRDWISRLETHVNKGGHMLTRGRNLKYRSTALTGALLLSACLTGVTSIVLAQEAPANVATAQRETLLQTTQSWNGKPYTHYPAGQPQLTTLKVTLAPHTSLPWHSHPVPNAVYVISGTLTLRDRASGKTLVVHQGQVVGESVDDVHRGEAGDEPAVLLITYAGTPGVPTSVPAKGEKAEY
jgi:quercetin dioxygenase-like cupin family protein